MIHGLYQSAAGMLTNEYRQNVLSNNLANADTVGFKRDVPVFAERQPEAAGGSRNGPSADWLRSLSGGVWLGQTATDHSAGPQMRTGNPLDAALAGPGFFVVQGANGPLHTRDGRFMTTWDGRLVSAADAAPVVGVGGTTIQVNPQGPTPTLDEDGQVLQGGAIVGQLAVEDFADYRLLEKLGDGRWFAQGVKAGASLARVKSEHVEASAVEAVPELTSMMTATRAYQLNARMVQIQDESLGRMISVIARG